MRRLVPLAVLLLAACVGYHRPQPATPAPATEIAAPEALAFDAAVDVFAARNLPIRSIERAAGFMSTDRLVVGTSEAKAWADCGRVIGGTLPPDRATYSVVVRGDSARSSALVMVRWTQGGHPDDPGQLIECATRGTREAELQAAIKARAEQRVGAR